MATSDAGFEAPVIANKKGGILNGVLAGKGGRSSKERNDALVEDREPLLMEDNLREQEQEQDREVGDEREEEEKYENYEEEEEKEEENADETDDDDDDDDDDMPLNAHDDETMSVLTPRSASVAAAGVAATTTAAVATTATMKKRTNGGIAKRAAALAAASEAKKAEKSSSGTQSKAKTVVAGGAAAGAYLFHKHREEKNDAADSNHSTTWITKDANGCWTDDVSKSTKSSRRKTRWSNRSTKPSKSGRNGFLLFGAGAAAVAAIRSRQGRKNAVDDARKLTAQERIVAANEQADSDSTDSKGSRFGLGRRGLPAGFRYKVTVDEPPAASEAAFVGPPRYDWIDIETAAAVKVQAAWRRYNTVKDLQRQDLYTVGMRNRGRAHRGALWYDHEYNTDGTGCLDAGDIKCGYDCGLDKYGFGTRRGMQNDDVPDFMACCGVGNLL